MSAFTRHRRSGAVIATFSGFEADLLRSLASQIVELLHHEAAVPDDRDPLEVLMDFSGPTTAPEDPVLARLFPTAYVEDEEAAAEFRRFTEGTLREGIRCQSDADQRKRIAIRQAVLAQINTNKLTQNRNQNDRG